MWTTRVPDVNTLDMQAILKLLHLLLRDGIVWLKGPIHNTMCVSDQV